MILSLKIDFDLVNSADHDEKPHNKTFHLGLHCQIKVPVNRFSAYRELKEYLDKYYNFSTCTFILCFSPLSGQKIEQIMLLLCLCLTSHQQLRSYGDG